MRAENRAKRRDHILDIAIEVLSERGYRDANMLEVARRARASKETLYSWFGDKHGLFEAVIKRNAASVQGVMESQLESDAPVDEALAAFGRALLALLVGESAVALNRAAISEAASDPRLAETLVTEGRQATLPAFTRFLQLHASRGHLEISSPEEAAEDFLGLLLGDLQIRRLLAVQRAPSKVQIEARAKAATEKFLRLHAATRA
ncbi:MAG: TetR/AcrR family transcriptional regulator [Alphaproteobacteria bacterium]|nr:TetR/AcrR family transcriptional regulator [Alphaproteobacteria bacterium]